MAVKFLDYTGLGYFWSKIKAWCNATFAAITHNHASNVVNAMTGYSKPNSTSAITTSDTLNQAVGKLEKAIDDADISSTVHISGNEFIGGTKEFGNSYYDSTREGETDWESSSLIIRYQNYIKGSGVPSANKYCNLLFLDKTGTNVNWNGRMGCVENDVLPDGAHRSRLVCYKNERVNGIDTRDASDIIVGYDSNDIKFATAPSTSEDRTAATDILTRNWIPKDARIVHTSGDESIAGNKTFTDYIAIDGTTGDIRNTTDNFYLRVCGGIGADASHGAKIALSGSGLTGHSQLVAGSFRIFTATPSGGSYISLYGKMDGTLTWNAKDITGDVHTTGNETIGGVKTFTDDIVVSGDINICKNNTTGLIRLCGGTGASYTSGAKFYAYGASSSTNAGCFYAATGGTSGKQFYGKPDGTFIWNGNSIQVSSDARLKTKLSFVSEPVLDAWEYVDWGEFKFLDAVKEKGDNARFHVGLIAQNVKEVFDSQNLNICSYGILCHENYSDNNEANEFELDDLWMVRYTEALCMEAAYQRRKNKILENRISELERQVSDMLQILQSLKGAN